MGIYGYLWVSMGIYGSILSSLPSLAGERGTGETLYTTSLPTILLPQPGLTLWQFRGGNVEVLIGTAGCHTSAGGALEKA